MVVQLPVTYGLEFGQWWDIKKDLYNWNAGAEMTSENELKDSWGIVIWVGN